MARNQAYVAVERLPSPTPAPLSPRRLLRSERERLSRLLSTAMLSAGWSIGMLARALDVGRSFARGLRDGDRRLNDEHVAALIRFPKMALALQRVGLTS